MGKVQKIILGVFLFGFFLNLGEIASASNIEKLFKQYEKVEFVSSEYVVEVDGEDPAGFYIVQKNKLFGILNKSGDIVLPLKYKSIVFAGDNFVLEQDNKFTIMTFAGEFKAKKYDKVVIDEKAIFAYIGNKIDVFLNNEEIFDIDEYKKYKGAFVLKKDNKYAVKIINGYQSVEFIYDSIEHMKEFSDLYYDAFYGYEGDKKFIISSFIVGLQIPNVEGVFITNKGEYYVIKKGASYYLYDLQGNNILGKGYKNIELLGEGKYVIVTQNGFQSLILLENKKVIFTNYEIEDIDSYYGDVFILKVKNKIIALDVKGNIILSGKDSISKSGYYGDDQKFFITTVDNKYGLYTLDGKKIFSEIYDDIEFESGMIQLTRGGKTQYATYDGKIFGANYDSINLIAGSQFKIKKGGKFGIIDKNQKTIIQIQFDDIQYDSENQYYIAIKGKEKKFFTLEGKKIELGKYNTYNKIWIYESSFDTLGDSGYGSYNEFYNGDVVFEGYKVGKNGKYGIIDKNGNLLIPTEFSDIKGYYEGGSEGSVLFVVENNKKYGIRDIKNTKILPVQYDEIYIYMNGFIEAKKGSISSIIGENGKELVSGVKNLELSWSYLIFEKNNGKKGVVSGGKIFLSPNYNNIIIHFDTIYAITDSQTYIYDMDGKNIGKYDFAFDEFIQNVNNQIIIKKGEKYGSMYSKNIFVKPQFDTYESMGSFLASVEIGGQQYVYNILNHQKVPGIGIKAISNDLFFTQSGSYYGIKNMSGGVLLQDVYQNIITLGVDNQKFLVQKDDKVFIIDASEKILETIDAESFDYSNIVVDGEYAIILKKGEKSGIMNVKGEKLIDIQYDYILQNDLSIVGKKGNTYYYFSDEMKPVLESENGELNIDIIDENYGIIAESSVASEYIVECQCDTNEGIIVDLKTLKPIVDKKFILTGKSKNNIISFVDSNKKAGFLNLKTKKISYLKWQFIKDISGGNYLVSNKDEFKLSIMNSKGKILKTYPYKLSSTSSYYKDFFVIVDKDGKEGIMDMSGKVVFTPKTKYLYFVPENNIYLASNDEVNYAVFIGEKQITGYDYSNFTYMNTYLILEKGNELFTLQLKDGTIEKLK